MMNASPIQLRRLLMLSVAVLLGLAGLCYRLVHLQVVRHEEFEKLADINTQKTLVREPRRGEIFDTRGNLLASSIFVKTVCANPELIVTNQALVAKTLAPLLGVEVSALEERLQRRTRINPRKDAKLKVVPVEYVVLKRKVREEEWLKIKKAMLALEFGIDEASLSKKGKRFFRDLRTSAIFVDRIEDQLREYPNGRLAAHVLGYVGMTEAATERGKILRSEGKDGIELIMNPTLGGVQGWRDSKTDRRENELLAFRQQDVAPKSGKNVVLTLDLGVQDIVESEISIAMEKLSPISVGVVVVRPRTGQILALSGRPTFDPNHPGDSTADSRRNRLICDTSEPGSTFKIVTVTGALSDRIVSPTDMFDCENGKFLFAGRWLHDDHHLGVLSVEEIISKSSNIGAAKIGIKLGPARLREHVINFGFGQRSGISLPGEVNGTVHPLERWTKLSISRIPMGHEVASTPLQTTMAVCAIANEGRLLRPMLIERILDDQGNTVAHYGPQVVRQAVTPRAAKQMVEALKLASSKHGTGTKAELDHYTVAGKTGTAKKAGNGGYMAGKYFSSYIGFLPAEDPGICIGVFLDEPKTAVTVYYGGASAAPIFKAIAERAANYLNLHPSPKPAPGASLAVGVPTGGANDKR